MNLSLPELQPGPPAVMDRALSAGALGLGTQNGIHGSPDPAACPTVWAGHRCDRPPGHPARCRCACDQEQPLIPEQDGPS